MIEAKELRIGNYVNSEVMGIEQINIIGILYQNKNNQYYKPIPLTEEWLIKFGFEKDENKPFHFIRLEEYNLEVMVNGFSGTLEKEPNWFCSIKSYAHQTTFQKMHVHQLQNLYFALTGEELTIKK